MKGFGKDTWVGAFAPRVLNAPTMEKYVSALYWAVTTFTTVGYGDIHPASRLEVRARVLFIVSRQWRGATSKKQTRPPLLVLHDIEDHHRHVNKGFRLCERRLRENLPPLPPAPPRGHGRDVEMVVSCAFMAINMVIAAFVIGNITILMTRADVALLAYRDDAKVGRVHFRASRQFCVVQVCWRARTRLFCVTVATCGIWYLCDRTEGSDLWTTTP